MITEMELDEAIAECQGVRHPDVKVCIKLAAFLIIKRELYGDPVEEIEMPSYSYAAPEVEYSGKSEFAKLIKGRDPERVWKVMDELMTTIQAVYPRLYDSVIHELS